MSYVKYNEDNIKINDDRLYMGSKKEIKKKSAPLIFVCPYCNKVYESKNILFTHVKNDHNIYTPIVLINGTIPQNDDEVYVSEIKSVIVKSYDMELQVKIDDQIQHCDGNEVFELTERVNAHIKKGFCVLKIAHKNIVIKLLSMNSITNPLVFKIIENWQKLTIDNKKVEKEYPSSFNDAEKIYLDAFFNYYIACRSEGPSKRDRYFDAYAVLSTFTDLNNMALCVLKVIAFRVNWFKTLENLSIEEDDFKTVSNFINCNFNKSIINNNLTGQLYIEDELQEILECITKYYYKDFDWVDGYLRKFSNIYDIKDVNLKDKILLLKARRAKDLGRLREMNYYYNEITDEFLKEDRLLYKGVNLHE